MRKHFLSETIVLLAGISVISACSPKEGPAAGESSTGEPQVEWPIGFFYRPGGRTPATGAVIMLDVKADFTVDMYIHYCTVDPRHWQTMSWRWVNDEKIEFLSLDPSEPLFYVKEGDQVSMKRQDDTSVRVIIESYGPEAEGIAYGEFHRLQDLALMWPCFVLLKPAGVKKTECFTDSRIEFGCPEPPRPD